jgi:hypothetical protein
VAYPVQVTGLGAEPSPAEEHLNLLAAAGTPLSAGTFGSFMDTCRLASDDIEIMHHTDTDGAAECNLSFRSFRDERTIPDAISSSIPVATQLSTLCGAPAAEESGCVPTFETGFWAKILVDTSLGPNIPVIGPWAWQFSFWRDGVFQARIYSSDNYTLSMTAAGLIRGRFPTIICKAGRAISTMARRRSRMVSTDWVTDPVY